MTNTILLADNDDDFLQKWSRVISEEKYNVLIASTPAGTRNILQQKKIDLAVLDIRMNDDNNPADISGLEIATDKSFRFIPKIMLTAFPTSYKSIREAYDYMIGELPPSVAFIDKTEGPSVLLDVIHNTLELWPKLRQSTITITDQIKYDHANTRQQARINYRIGLSISLFGFAVIILGICLAWFDKLTMGIVGSTTGVILEALGYLFFKRLDLANDRMDIYHKELLQTYWLEYILAACEQLPTKKQVRCAEKAIDSAIGSWLSQQDNTGFLITNPTPILEKDER